MENTNLEIVCPFNTEKLFSFLKEKGLGKSKQESIYVILANQSEKHGEVFEIYETSRGSFNEVKVYFTEILRPAIENRKDLIVLAHNHPSGDVIPSKDDLYLTSMLINIASRLNIVVRDHVVFNDKEIFSMRDSGVLEKVTEATMKYIIRDQKSLIKACDKIDSEDLEPLLKNSK